METMSGHVCDGVPRLGSLLLEELPTKCRQHHLKGEVLYQIKRRKQDVQVAQWIKMFATKCVNLSLILETHVEERGNFQKLSSDL